MNPDDPEVLVYKPPQKGRMLGQGLLFAGLTAVVTLGLAFALAFALGSPQREERVGKDIAALGRQMDHNEELIHTLIKRCGEASHSKPPSETPGGSTASGSSFTPPVDSGANERPRKGNGGDHRKPHDKPSPKPSPSDDKLCVGPVCIDPPGDRR